VADLLFTPWREWARFEGGEVTIGLTGDGFKGDVVYIELPDIGRQVEKGDACASVETVKAVFDVHAPVNGIVIAVNDSVFDDPDIIARRPLDTWLLKLSVLDDDRQSLLTEQQYAALIRTD
jgi:glycine cleavage system H protein